MLGDILLGFAAILTVFLCVTVAWHAIYPIPFVPTPGSVMDAMIRMAHLNGNETVFDLGAGDGRLLAAVLKKYPRVSAVGYEVIPTVWLLGWIRKSFQRASFTLHLKDALTADVSRADVIFLYLFPEVMNDLRKMFDAQLRPGTLVVSNTFKFSGKEPEATETVRLSTGRIVSIHMYRW